MMKPEMNDELVMDSEIIYYLVKTFLLKSDAILPFATQLNLHLLPRSRSIAFCALRTNR